MDGDLAPLRSLRALADEHKASLVVDEAHATGIIGPNGQGLAAELGVAIDVHIATLGKAFGVFGAYVTGSRILIDYLVNRARAFIFTTALPPAVTSAAEAALDLHRVSSWRRELRARLARNISQLAAGLERTHATPIIPIPTPAPQRAMEITDALLARDIYVQGIRPPTVPLGGSRLRIALMATHEPEQIERALSALREVL